MFWGLSDLVGLVLCAERKLSVGVGWFNVCFGYFWIKGGFWAWNVVCLCYWCLGIKFVVLDILGFG